MTREERAAQRRATWRIMELDEPFDTTEDSVASRLRRMEELRRASYVMQGVPYPDSPTPKEERAQWPVTVRS